MMMIIINDGLGFMGTWVHGYKGTWVHGYIFLVHWHVGCLKVCIHSDNDDDDKIFKKIFKKNFQKNFQKIFFSIFQILLTYLRPYYPLLHLDNKKVLKVIKSKIKQKIRTWSQPGFEPRSFR